MGPVEYAGWIMNEWIKMDVDECTNEGVRDASGTVVQKYQMMNCPILCRAQLKHVTNTVQNNLYCNKHYTKQYHL